ncbi:MAG: hypothetical protein ACXVHX_02135 [Solirubrobacteraceae bacterium]
MSSGEHQYMAGYNAGRSACLRSGSSETGRQWLRESARSSTSAFIAGYEWALWDYDDANGLAASTARQRGHA